jgi:DNA mismatch repair protein MutS2
MLCALVSDRGRAIALTVQLLAELDLAFAKGKYSYAIQGVEPLLIVPESSGGEATVAEADPNEGLSAAAPPGTIIWLQQARHPLLDPETVVPVDIHLGGEFSILLITGPNTGGKTVALKTVGLLAAMTQAGLHIPAREDSALTVLDGLYADIGDEQSIEQSLSTFSSHMTNIVNILANADGASLVLLDELGAGTDPVEGAALARAILGHLQARGVHTIGTTHYSELKLYAHSTPGVQNASVEFDIETLSPTYRITIGLPGQSQAFAIASRLGISAEIIDSAREWISEEELQVEEMLGDIRIAREKAQEERENARAILKQARRWKKELTDKTAAIEEAREVILNEARTEAAREIDEMRKQLRRLTPRLGADAVTREWIEEAGQALDEFASAAQPLPNAPAPPLLKPSGDIKAGDMVWVPSLQQQGLLQVVDGNAAEVSIGQFRVRVRTADLDLIERAPESEPESITLSRAQGSAPRPTIELEIRGLRVEDALPEVDKYLDSAYLAGMPFVRIIHGKGTGVLRQAIREQLDGHPLVKQYRSGVQGEGDSGVTVVDLIKH